MATPAQIHANQNNAQASTGPRTGPGKARSAANARTFGLFSTRNTVAPEELDEYNELCAGLRNELQPATLLEEALAKEILRALWRLRRCEIVEAGRVEAGPTASNTLDSDPAQIAIDRAQANATLRRSYDALSRMQTDRQIGADTGAEQQGIARQKDILLTRLLKRRLDGLHKFQTILRQADAEIAKRSQFNTPRNAPCPCASGEKYKRCCGRHAPPVLHGPSSEH